MTICKPARLNRSSTPSATMRALTPLCMACFAGLIGLAPAQARAQTCVVQANNTLDFGEQDLTHSTGPVSISTTLRYRCRNAAHTTVRRRVCLGIGAASGGGGAATPHKMTNATQDALLFQLYKSASHQDVWGPANGTGGAVPYIQHVLIASGQTREVQVTIYGQILANQGAVRAGTYERRFMDIDTSLQYEDVNTDTLAPCTSARRGGFDLAVKARIRPSCTVAAAPLDFGTVPGLPGSTGILGQTSIRVTCSGGTQYNVALTPGNANTGGSGVMTSATPGNTNTVAYQLYQDAPRSRTWGNLKGTNDVVQNSTGAEKSLTVYGRIPDANVTPGTYSDTVTVRVDY